MNLFNYLNKVYCEVLVLIDKQGVCEASGQEKFLLESLNKIIDELLSIKPYINFDDSVVLLNCEYPDESKGYDLYYLDINQDLDYTYDDKFVKTVQDNMSDLLTRANLNMSINDSLFTYLTCLQKVKKYNRERFYRAACIIRTVLRVAMPKYH